MELLSPAGSPQSFKAALESGANAVYLGLPWFNARKPAKNFTPEVLKESLEEAHKKGVKVYVTLNTDIKPNEIEEAAKVLTLLSSLDIDAVIIKDFGLYYMAKECFPNLELHLSTQFGISNSYAAEQAKKLGASRVIPARELSFDELEQLQRSGRDIPEVEAFVQGSMCFAFSGKCLLSSWVGGKSANRGVCQAPCRLKYKSNDKEFPFFSMKDLNLVKKLDNLEKANISSLKIEGRLKNPEWVGSITSIYHSALSGELDYDKSSDTLLKYSGREMGEGFASSFTDLTAKHRAKFGSYLGTVSDTFNNGDDSFAILDIKEKASNTSLRFVSEADEFLTIIHPEALELNKNDKDQWILNSNGRITKGALIYEVIPAPRTKTGIGNMRYDVELEVEGGDIVVSVVTDGGTFKDREQYKKVVKAKRGVYPDSIYDKLIDKVVNGWRFNKLYCEDILLSKTQVNSIVKIVSYILAVTIRESNPLNQIELSETTQSFIKSLDGDASSSNTEVVRVKAKEISNINAKNIVIDEVENIKTQLDKIVKLTEKSHVTVSIFPINFEADMNDVKGFVEYLESKCSEKNRVNYEINDIGHYNLLVNYLGLDKDRLVAGQGMACYNHLAIKYFKEVLGINSLSIPMEMDSRGVVKIVEENSNFANLRFTTLSTVPVMYSRVSSDEFAEGSQFVDRIGTEIYVHKFRDLNIFVADDYYSSEGCKDLDGIKFSEVISEKECLDNPSHKSKTFNLERRLY